VFIEASRVEKGTCLTEILSARVETERVEHRHDSARGL
jgi:hypothetical protein